MANPNIELFRRTAPMRKIEIIKNLTDSEILNISTDTVKRMVKETGFRRGKSRDRELYIDSDRRKGNGWNSVVEGIELLKDKLYVWAYVQYENTDTTQTVSYADFFCNRDFRGEIEHSDRYGNPQTYYYIYDSRDKAQVLRSICLEYIYRKYKDKLG